MRKPNFNPPAFTVLLALAPLAVAQNPASTRQPQTLTTQSTLVLIPALVRDPAGHLVYTLNASDFTLTDDGIPQKLRLEQDAGAEPLALVVDLEVGGAGAREFAKLAASLTPMLSSVVGAVPHRIAVVGFDSQPALVQPFTSSDDQAANAIYDLTPGCSREHHIDDCASPHAQHDESRGDNGAAILDSLAFSVSLLARQPPQYRRAILLISESLDRGSQIKLEDAIRAVSDSNTVIYAIAFSTGKSEAAHYAHRELPTQPPTWAMGSNPLQPGGFTFFALQNHIPNPPHGCMGKQPDPHDTGDPDKSTNTLARLYDCTGQLLPPLLLAKTAAIAAWDGVQRNVPETVAHLTGGEYFKLTDARSLEQSLLTIANHLPNRYVLSFQPKDPHPGLHALTLQLPDHTDLAVTARATYWAR
jgi:VWFA-related protein